MYLLINGIVFGDFLATVAIYYDEIFALLVDDLLDDEVRNLNLIERKRSRLIEHEDEEKYEEEEEEVIVPKSIPKPVQSKSKIQSKVKKQAKPKTKSKPRSKTRKWNN